METRVLKHVVWAAWGVLAGFAAASLLAAITMSNFFSLPMPWEQWRALQPLARFGGWAQKGATAALAGAGIMLFPAWLLIASEINPGLFAALRARKGFAVALSSGALVLLTAGLLASVGEWGLGDFAAFLPLLGPFSGDGAWALIIAGVSAAAAWTMLAEEGWAGPDFQRRPLRASIRKEWLRVAGLGSLYGAALVLSVRAATRLFTFLFFYNIQVWHPSSLVRYDAMLVNVLILVGLGALMGLTTGGLASLLAPDREPVAGRLQRAWPSLAAVLVCGAAALGLRAHGARAHQWLVPDITQAAGLPDRQATALTLVTLAFDRTATVAVKPWELAMLSSEPGLTTRAAATEANTAALRAFLAERAAASRWALTAQSLLPALEALLWRSRPAFTAVPTPGLDPLVLMTIIERTWLAQAAPITAENRARLAALSDETVFRVEGKHALRLARAWLRFGDLGQARRWLEKGSVSASEQEIKDLMIPATAPRGGGIVAGRLVVAGRPGTPIRVGLFVAHKTHSAPYPGMSTLARLVDAVPAGKDGSFHFADLSEGTYGLALLLPQDAVAPDAKKLTATGHPGIITLDAHRRRADLGTITLALKK